LLALPEYQNAKAISVYLSMPSGEISTADIIAHAFQNGKQVFVPYTYKLPITREFWPTSLMDMVQLASLEDYKSLDADNWGIPTPSKKTVGQRANCFGGLGQTNGETGREVTDEELDIIIMPGMAFDRTLERLGHGKGFYDFFLQRYLWHSQKAKRKMPLLGELTKRTF
jgi:5-formyltetrahydrofolate cyclo-ligase